MASQRGFTTQRAESKECIFFCEVSAGRKTFRGFTLIELLVVIAIIGILSAVVLASLNQARNKGNDAAIQSNLSAAQVQAELYYSSNNNSYGSLGTGTCPTTAGSGNVFTDQYIVRAINGADTANGSPTPANGAAGAGGTKCNSVAQAYAIYAYMTAQNGYWCVDSGGNSKFEATYPGNGVATSCP
jgi:prepilin-type N-terminal cleavage/methylation domain-containing protein